MTVGDLIAEISEGRTGFLGNNRKLVAPKSRNKVFDLHARIFAQRKAFVKRRLCAMPIPLCAEPRLNGRVNKHQCRKQWLRAFQEQAGGVNELAEKVGSDASYISSILGPKAKRNVGDTFARRVERAFRLPAGTMDLPSEAAMKIIAAIEGLTEKEFEEVMDFIRFKKATKN